MHNISKLIVCNRLSELLATTALTCALTMFLAGPAQGGMANPSTVDFGSVPVYTTGTKNVAITIDAGYYIANTSGAGTSAPFGFNYGTCVGVGGFTGPGTCTAMATFTPTALGFIAVVADILECPVAGGFCSTISYNVQGTGVSVAAANPPLVDFGNVQINTTSAIRFVMITIDAGYSISGGGISGSTEFSWQEGTCAANFPGPATCSVSVTFSPLVAGPVAGRLDVGTCPTVGTCTTLVLIHANSMGNGVVVGPPMLLGAASRKVHGSAGTFDLPLSMTSTNPTTEPRQGPAQTIVFTFDKPANAASVTITEGTATASAPTFSGNDVIVGLTGVTNQQYVTVSLTNVASSDGGTGGGGSVRLGFLVGDVNQNRVVAVSDLGLVNAQLAQPVNATNYLKDVNATGTLTVADKGIANANLTHALPAP